MPEECVTTNPAVVLAVGKLVRAAGCSVTIADSPGSFLPYTHETLTKVYSRSGMLAAARGLGIPVNLGVGSQEVTFKDGRSLKRFNVIDPVMEADAVIVISKLKTHLATGLTAGTKNIYGVVPGLEKKAIHARLRTPRRFADALVDINESIRPRLQIIDAVMAMEGDGPTGGKPRAMNAIIAGGSPYAVDTVAARLMRLDPMRVTTLQAASRRKLIDIDAIDVAGESIGSMTAHDFALPYTFANASSSSSIKEAVASAISRLGLDRAKPVVSVQSCRGCGACVRSCPAEAIQLVEKKAHIDRRKCINCYCCHEMCTKKAIELEKGFLGRALDRAIVRGETGG
jgi:uncharacterized protein (DUF362 family)/Pyruvate/2-oxoacid:ferredoxin oxidoreductase delta subunit